MSGIKPIDLTLFYRKLHDRKRGARTVEQIAKKIFSSRAHVTEVLNGNRSGGQTWRKLARVLTKDELALLGRDKEGNRLPDFPDGGIVPPGASIPVPEGPEPFFVPRETLSHVEHHKSALTA
jgi:hypothetical protein